MNHDEAFAAGAVTAWNNQLKQATKLFAELSDEQLMAPLAPGRNRPVYLLGHLTAVHDAMMPLFGFGERKHAGLDGQFLAGSDDAAANYPTVAELRRSWEEVNSALSKAINELPASDWLQRHTSVSEEDFAKQPHRNRFAVLLSRTTHLGYHAGQLALAPKAT